MSKKYLPEYAEEDIVQYDRAYDEGTRDAQLRALDRCSAKNDAAGDGGNQTQHVKFESGTPSRRGYDDGVKAVEELRYSRRYYRRKKWEAFGLSVVFAIICIRIGTSLLVSIGAFALACMSANFLHKHLNLPIKTRPKGK